MLRRLLGKLKLSQSQNQQLRSRVVRVQFEINHLGPSARRAANEHSVSSEAIVGTGKDGRVTKSDIIAQATSGQATKKAPQVTKITSTEVREEQTGAYDSLT